MPTGVPVAVAAAPRVQPCEAAAAVVPWAQSCEAVAVAPQVQSCEGSAAAAGPPAQADGTAAAGARARKVARPPLHDAVATGVLWTRQRW